MTGISYGENEILTVILTFLSLFSACRVAPLAQTHI